MKKIIITLLVYLATIAQCISQNPELIAGTGTSGYSGNGDLALNAELNSPRHLVFDNLGNLYFADQKNHVIRKIDNNGIITTIAGNGSSGYSGDGSQATSAQLDNPRGICLDINGHILIADSGNNTIRKLDINGIITTLAGNGSSGYSGDNQLASSSQLSDPRGVNVDDFGNIYIADTGNFRIRKIDVNNIISTIAGNGTNSYSGDNDQAINAGFEAPYDVIINNDNIYIADINDSRIRKINSLGIISTILNNNGTHIINNPSSLNFDNNGNLFVSGLGGTIYKIDNLENTSIVFDNLDGGSGGIAFDSNFNLYFTATFANQIKKINSSTLTLNELTPNEELKLFPNPTQDDINIKISNIFDVHSINIYDSTGRLLKNLINEEIESLNNKKYLKIAVNSTGVYFMKIMSNQGLITEKFIKY